MTHPCPRCGAALEVPGETCPRCLFDQAVRAGAAPVEEGAVPEASSRPRGPRTPAPTPAELAPLFPELEIEGLLGEGGMGAVYRAKQKKLGRTVALKILHADLSADPAFVARFLREASALARLAHPGIVTVYEYGEQGARCWLLMEFVDGTNLRALLRQRSVEPRQALAIVRQLCDALQFAHDEGIVHRDIKPENVLVDRRGSVKLADFGLAKLVGAPEASLTQVDQVMGTPHYMAPEQVERPRDVDHRADLYSLGVVFYEMLTGELPLGRFAAPSKRVEVDVRLDEIVLRALEHERERRYQHAVQVKTDVQRVEASPAAERPRPVPEAEPELQATIGLIVDEEGWRVMPGEREPGPVAWFCILFVAWLVCGASFNLGLYVFAPVSLMLLPWLFVCMVRYRPGWTKPTDARASRKRREAIGLVILGLLALFGAFVGWWDRFTFTYSAPAASADAGMESIRGRELETLRTLDPSLELVSLEPELQVTSASVGGMPWLRHPGLLFTLALVLLANAAWAWARPELKQALPLMASALYLFLGPLACVLFLNFAFQGFKTSGTSVHAGREYLSEELEPVAGRLRAACIEEGWHVSSRHEARIVDRLTGDELAEVHTFVAAPSSPFERWRMSWRGPLRVEPQVVFTLLSRPDTRGAPHTRAFANGGLAEHGSAEEWSAEIAALLRHSGG